jgi:hypothetical protein
MLGASLVAAGHDKVIPLEPEFIAPQDGAAKQDCENAAAKRWLAAHGQQYARLNPIYPGDDLAWSKNPSDRLFMRPLDDSNAGARPIARGIGRTALDRGHGSEEIAGRCPFLEVVGGPCPLAARMM